MTYFLSYLMGKAVRDRDGLKVGTLRDLVIHHTTSFLPEVAGVVVQHGKNRIFVAMAQVADLAHEGVKLDVSGAALELAPGAEASVLLRRDILDAQVVDTNGAKVVRVNDVLVMRSGDRYLVSGLDIGPWGLMRRMGWAYAFAGLVKATQLKVPEGVIPWDTMEPLEKDPTRMHLKVSQDRLVRMHPADLASVIEAMGHEQRSRLYDQLTDEQLADILEESEPAMQSAILHELEPERAADVLEEMEPDEAADLLGEMSEEEASAFIDRMAPEEAAEVRQLLAYDDDTAGALMTTSFIALPAHTPVGEAIERFRTEFADAEIIAYFYLTAPEGTLTGVVSIRRLLLTRDLTTSMGAIVAEKLYAARVHDTAREAVELVSRYNLTALPVLDPEGRIVGVISAHDVMEWQADRNG